MKNKIKQPFTTKQFINIYEQVPRFCVEVLVQTKGEANKILSEVNLYAKIVPTKNCLTWRPRSR